MKFVMKLAAILAVTATFATHADTQYAFCQAANFESQTTYVGDVMVDNEYRYREVFKSYLTRRYSYDADNSEDFRCSHKSDVAGLDSIMRDRIDSILFWIELNHRVQEIHAYDLNRK